MAKAGMKIEDFDIYEANEAFAAQSVAETALQKAASYGLREVHVYVKGPGMGRENAIRSIGAMGLRVKSISDVTPIPHNGCRPRKTRRM